MPLADDPEAPAQPPTPGLRSRPIDGRRDFEATFREALSHVAAAPHARELFLCDADFADWPIGERSVVALFEAWARSHRRLVMIACGFDDLARRHPRWVLWRQNWSHVVDCRLLSDIEPEACPSRMHAPQVCTLRLFDARRHRGAYSEGDERVDQAVRAEFDVLSQRSEPGFPVTTLGL